MKRSIVAVLFMMLLGAVISSCSSSSGGGDTGGSSDKGNVKLTGSVDSSSGTGYQHKGGLGVPLFGVSWPIVDQVVAIPMDRGSLRSEAMASRVTSSIDAGGGFSLSLSKNYDWLVVLVNSTATGTNRFVGSVGISADTAMTTDGLFNLPASVAAISSLSLGTISRPTSTSNDALSDAATAVTGTDFHMTTGQLTTLAKTDGIFRNAKNTVNNYDIATGRYYQLRSDFSYTGVTSSLSNTYSDPATYVYNGMNFQLDTNSPSITMAQICTAGSVTLMLIPPADVASDGSTTYGPSNPISNVGSAPSCTSKITSGVTTTEAHANTLYATDSYTQGLGGMSYSTMPLFITTPIPDGYWNWQENGVVAASFDVSGVNPPITVDGHPKGFIPSFRINLASGATSTGAIASVDVKWFYYDELSSSYLELAQSDLSVLQHFILRLEVKFDVTYGGSRKTCEMYFDPATTSNVSPSDPAFGCSDTWYFNDPGHPATNTGLMGFYESGGFGNFFNFR